MHGASNVFVTTDLSKVRRCRSGAGRLAAQWGCCSEGSGRAWGDPPGSHGHVQWADGRWRRGREGASGRFAGEWGHRVSGRFALLDTTPVLFRVQVRQKDTTSSHTPGRARCLFSVHVPQHHDGVMRTGPLDARNARPSGGETPLSDTSDLACNSPDLHLAATYSPVWTDRARPSDARSGSLRYGDADVLLHVALSALGRDVPLRLMLPEQRQRHLNSETP